MPSYRLRKLLMLALTALLIPVSALAQDTVDTPHPAGEIPESSLHYLTCEADGSAVYVPYPDATAAYQWLNIVQEVTARDVDKVGARPTIIARQMAIALTAMYDAWAAYDPVAVGTRLGGELRRPASEHTQANKEEAIAYAVHDALLFVFPEDKEYIDGELARMGYDPD